MANPHSVCSPDPADPASCLLAVKAVPGASRDQIAGVMEFPDGPRLKVRVATAPESGKANKAIERLLAEALGIAAKDVTLVSSPSNPLKTFRAQGLEASEAIARLDA